MCLLSFNWLKARSDVLFSHIKWNQQTKSTSNWLKLKVLDFYKYLYLSDFDMLLKIILEKYIKSF